MMRNLFQSKTALSFLCVMSLGAQGWAQEQGGGPAIPELKTAVERGDGQAAARLGDRYSFGLGVAKDNNEAFRWYQKGADLGNAQAQSRLGDAYQFGRGVQTDYIAAIQWYETALAANNGHAAYQLGRMHDLGRGGKTQEAMKYYSRGIALNDPEAMTERAYRLLYETGALPPEMLKNLTTVDDAASQNGTGISGKWECAVRSSKYLKINAAIEGSGESITSLYETLRMDLGKSVSTIKINGNRIVESGEFSPGIQSRAFFNVVSTAPYKYEVTYNIVQGRYLYMEKVPFAGKSGENIYAICRKIAEQDGSLLNY